MRSIAVITPNYDAFEEWARKATGNPVYRVTRMRVSGDGWVAHHISDMDLPKGVAFTEIVILEGYGERAFVSDCLTACLAAMPSHVLPKAA